MSQAPTTTEWLNPTKDTVTLRIHQGPGQVDVIRLEPGEKVRLSSVYDQAIQKTSGGAIIGGLAPQLRRPGQAVPVARALKPERPTVVSLESASAKAEIDALKQQVEDLESLKAAVRAAEARANKLELALQASKTETEAAKKRADEAEQLALAQLEKQETKKPTRAKSGK